MRILTLVVHTEDPPPHWIYDSHLKGKTGVINGLKVLKIAEGDIVRERDSLSEELEAYDYYGED